MCIGWRSAASWATSTDEVERANALSNNRNVDWFLTMGDKYAYMHRGSDLLAAYEQANEIMPSGGEIGARIQALTINCR